MSHHSSKPITPNRTIRSFVRREGRLTPAQLQAINLGWPRFGIDIQAESQLDLMTIFGRDQPRILEIGYGNGDCLAQMANQYPQYDFLGIEVYRPGIGRLCQYLLSQQLTNVRLLQMDAVEVIAQHLPASCVMGVHVFFPDPWPKKRHHKRRLIQADFVEHMAKIISPGGYLYLATDWADYAQYMQAVMGADPQFTPVTKTKPILFERPQRSHTRFEVRGQRLGHDIVDLIYLRN